MEERTIHQEVTPIAAPRRAFGLDRITTFRALSHRNFRLFWLAQIVSLIGTWMQSTAQGWLVYDISRSPMVLGVVGFAQFLPVLLFSLVGGALADQMAKRTLLVATQTIALVQAAVLAALVFTGVVQVWHIVILAFMVGSIMAFDAPARQAFVIEMVGREDLLNAIALNSMAFNIARVIGPTIAGGLLAAVGAGLCFTLNALSFVPVIFVLASFPIRGAPTRRNNGRMSRSLFDGLRYVRGKREVWGLLLLIAVGSAFGMSYMSLMPAIAREVFHAGAEGYASLLAFTGIGALVGGVSLATFGHKWVKGRVITRANFGFPLAIIAFALAPSLAVGCVFVMLVGAGMVASVVTSNTIIQMTVDDEHRGRAMSVLTIAFMGMFPLGALQAGFVAQHLGVDVALILGATVCLIGAAWLHLHVPEVREIR